MQTNPFESPFTPEEQLSMLKESLREAAQAMQDKGAGAERQLFERLQAEYEELTGEIVSVREALNF